MSRQRYAPIAALACGYQSPPPSRARPMTSMPAWRKKRDPELWRFVIDGCEADAFGHEAHPRSAHRSCVDEVPRARRSRYACPTPPRRSALAGVRAPSAATSARAAGPTTRREAGPKGRSGRRRSVDGRSSSGRGSKPRCELLKVHAWRIGVSSGRDHGNLCRRHDSTSVRWKVHTHTYRNSFLVHVYFRASHCDLHPVADRAATRLCRGGDDVLRRAERRGGIRVDHCCAS